MQTKTQQAMDFYRSGDYLKALAILRGFRRLSNTEKEAFNNGYEAKVHPRFYRQTRGDAWIEQKWGEAISMLHLWAHEHG